MKKFLAAILLSLLLFPFSLLTIGCGGEGKAPAPKENAKIGVITHLNASEIEYNEIMKKLEKSYRPSKADLDADYKYFNRMTDMQFALESGQIDMLSTYQSVADYMLKNSDNKEILKSEKILSDSFCFAVREGDKMLKHDLDTAIKEMTTDGTLSKLSKHYIIDLEANAEPPAVEIVEIPNAETIRVAVTGDLPPFDMISADGMPTGFSTAVLSEVSKRIGKNIELISIDSGARASILSSKGADVVFWVAVPENSTLIPANIDQPTGIAISEPYYHDNIVHVGNK